ncbi:oxidoreductase [Xylariaceae sp. FL1651]|nr:oxidoreductase [Xylariaceae sp. FL1651]
MSNILLFQATTTFYPRRPLFLPNFTIEPFQPPIMSPIRVGIVGLHSASGTDAATASGKTGNDEPSRTASLGQWAVLTHLPAIRAMPDNYEIVAVCNSSVESAARAIKTYGLPDTTKVYGNPKDLANDPCVDYVVISVGVSKHFELAKPALEKKKAVFVEWPLGASLAQSEELAKLADAAGVRTSVGVQARADPLVVKLKEIVESGQIGKVVNSSVLIGTSFLPLSLWPEGAEYYLDHKSGGNEFFISLGHFLDSFTHVLGDFAEVQAILKSTVTSVPIVNTKGELVNPGYPKTSPDQMLVQGVLENDAMVSISMRKSKTEVDNISFRWIVSGTEGAIEVLIHEMQWQFGEPKRTLKLKIGNQEVQNVRFIAEDDEFESKVPFPGVNPARQHRAFAEGNEGSVATFQSALKTHRLLDRILKAAGWETV